MATTNTADNNEPNQELALLDAESYYNVPNRAELIWRILLRRISPHSMT